MIKINTRIFAKEDVVSFKTAAIWHKAEKLNEVKLELNNYKQTLITLGDTLEVIAVINQVKFIDINLGMLLDELRLREDKALMMPILKELQRISKN